jgi:hypothetical protein
MSLQSGQRKFRVARYVSGLALFVAVVAVGAVTAVAGTPSLNGAGHFLFLEMHISPPRAGTNQRPRGVSLEFHDLSGNILTGAPGTGTAFDRIEQFRLAKGMKVNYKVFPACKYARLARFGPPACPRDSQVGAGTLLSDFRPVVPGFIPAPCSLFNGRYLHNVPSLLVWCKTDFGSSGTLPFDILPPVRGFGPRFVINSGPVVPTGPTLASKGADFTFPDSSVIVRGRRVHYLEAPSSCHGSWLFEQVNIRYDGTQSVATDRQPCVS